MERIEVLRDIVVADNNKNTDYAELTPISEIAKALGLSERSVRNTLERALVKMKREFKRKVYISTMKYSNSL